MKECDTMSGAPCGHCDAEAWKEYFGISDKDIDENAETLEDKLRDEHRPIPEEREDASLFETMAEKFKPKQEEEWDKNDGKGPIRYNTFKEIIEDD